MSDNLMSITISLIGVIASLAFSTANVVMLHRIWRALIEMNRINRGRQKPAREINI